MRNWSSFCSFFWDTWIGRIGWKDLLIYLLCIAVKIEFFKGFRLIRGRLCIRTIGWGWGWGWDWGWGRGRGWIWLVGYFFWRWIGRSRGGCWFGCWFWIWLSLLLLFVGNGEGRLIFQGFFWFLWRLKWLGNRFFRLVCLGKRSLNRVGIGFGGFGAIFEGFLSLFEGFGLRKWLFLDRNLRGRNGLELK